MLCVEGLQPLILEVILIEVERLGHVEAGNPQLFFIVIRQIFEIVLILVEFSLQFFLGHVVGNIFDNDGKICCAFGFPLYFFLTFLLLVLDDGKEETPDDQHRNPQPALYSIISLILFFCVKLL